MDIDKYDEYVARPEQEVITVETKIKPSNKGFAMLAKLGWVEGQPLGASGEGNLVSYYNRKCSNVSFCRSSRPRPFPDQTRLDWPRKMDTGCSHD